MIIQWVGGGPLHTRPQGQIPLPSPEHSPLRLVQLAMFKKVQKPPSSTLEEQNTNVLHSQRPIHGAMEDERLRRKEQNVL